MLLTFCVISALPAMGRSLPQEPPFSGKAGRVRTIGYPDPTPMYGYEVVHTYPHDPQAFTEGLLLQNGFLWESTGQEGHSSIRKVELKTGKILKRLDIPKQYFGEGLSLFQGKFYQLTWQTNKGFIYEEASLKKIGEFSYTGEGWGLTHDEKSLIMSDGTNQLRFLDPVTLKTKRTISVFFRNAPLMELNELEVVKGEIYANVWHTDYIARIDPKTGKLLGMIDLTGLLPLKDRTAETDVLNGIAYDAAHDRLYVTGKMWPKLFEIRVKKR